MTRRDEAVLTNFLLQYYEGAQYIPKLVVDPRRSRTTATTMEELLTEKRGVERSRSGCPSAARSGGWSSSPSENATRSARHACAVKWMADANKTEQALEQLREELSLPDIPRRIECYDNSNIQGDEPGFEHGRLHRWQAREQPVPPLQA